MKFPVVTIIMVLMSGTFFMLYILFNYAFIGAPFSMSNALSDMANDTIGDSSILSNYHNQSNLQNQFFGYGCISCIILCPVCGFLELTRKESDEG